VSGRAYNYSRVYAGLATENRRPYPYGAVDLGQSVGGVESGAAFIYFERSTPVEPGSRIELQARVGGYAYAGAAIRVAYYSLADAFITSAPLSGVTTLAVSEAYTGIGAVEEDDYFGYQTLASFKHLYGFADVPEGVARARLIVDLNRSAASGSTSLAMAMPYLGIARVGQVEPSAWGPGPSGGLIESLDAVTEVIEASVTEQDLDATPILFEQAFTPTLDGSVEITLTAALTGDLVNTGVGKAYCGLEMLLYEGTSSGTLRVTDRSRIIPWSTTLVGETHSSQGAQMITYDVTAYQLYTVKVSAFVDATKFDNVVANYARLRVTEVYR
jgi:hypothetical protein